MLPVARLSWASPIFLLYAHTLYVADASAAGPTLPKGVSTTRVNCLDAMNKARTRAGLPPFVDASQTNDLARLPVDDQGFQSYLCYTVLQTAKVSATGAYFKRGFDEGQGTLAYFPQEGSPADCNAAVELWKSAFANFDSLPPVFEDIQAPYTGYQNISFFSLFNPQANAAVDCAFATCPVVPETDDLRQAQNTKKEYSGLLCRTSPAVFTVGSRPFTTEQWEKITDSFTNSASIAMPAFFTFAAAALAVAFL